MEKEKEIYITQAICGVESECGPRQKTVMPPSQVRPQSAKPLSKKVVFNFLPETYYDDKRVKPGVAFYKLILEIEQRRALNQYKGPFLRMAIPETVLLNDNSNSMIFTQNGEVHVETFTSNESFLRRVETKPNQLLYPCILHSSVSGITFNDSIMMNTQVAGNKVIPRSEGFVCRRFIQPYASTPNILRLHFWSRNTRSLRKNYAYKLVHVKSMSEDLFRKKHRLLQNFIINPERQESYSVTLLAGKALQTVVSMAESLTEYLQKGAGIRTSELVIDFIIDQDKTPWLYQIKSIKSRTLTKLWDIGGIQELQLLTEKSNSSHLCKLCNMTYSRQEMQKIVTNKLIWELVAHLRARGIDFDSPSHLRKQGLSYLCDTCYEVVVAEHKLIDVERQFSSLLNLSPNAVERIPVLTPKMGNIVEQEMAPSSSAFKAWRLFFYIERIKNYESIGNKTTAINLQMRFNGQKQQFSKNILGEGGDHSAKSRFSSMVRAHSALIRSKVEQYKFDGKSVETMTTMASKVVSPLHEAYSIQKVKIFVVYTRATQTASLFPTTQLEFSLSINDEKFTGRSSTLQALKNRDTCQRHSSEVFLFDEKLRYCNLQLTVGLICDGEVSSDNVAGAECIQGVFYQRQGITVCRPLPDEWMEVFTKGQSLPLHTLQVHSAQSSFASQL